LAIAASLRNVGLGGGIFLCGAFVIGLISILGWFETLIAAGRMAAHAQDWLGLTALLIMPLATIAGFVYVNVALGRTGPGHVGLHVLASGGLLFPSNLAPLLTPLPALLLTPLVTLLYALLEKHRVPRLVVTNGLAAITIAVPLIIAPPWVVLNPPPQLAVNAFQFPQQPLTANCAQGLDAELRIENSGGGTLKWHFAFSTDKEVTMRPIKGSLTSGGDQSVYVGTTRFPPLTVPQSITIAIDSNGGTQRLTYQCTSTG
jgi:hypothetical protein